MAITRSKKKVAKKAAKKRTYTRRAVPAPKKARKPAPKATAKRRGRPPVIKMSDPAPPISIGLSFNDDGSAVFHGDVTVKGHLRMESADVSPTKEDPAPDQPPPNTPFITTAEAFEAAGMGSVDPYVNLRSTYLEKALNNAMYRAEDSLESYGRVDIVAADIAAFAFNPMGGVKASSSDDIRELMNVFGIIGSLAKYTASRMTDGEAVRALVDAALVLDAQKREQRDRPMHEMAMSGEACDESNHEEPAPDNDFALDT